MYGTDRSNIFGSTAGAVLLAITALAAVGNAMQYPENQPPLKPTPFASLPLGSVKARGWLLKQLQLQRDGLTGHAEEALVELNETSAWRGGDKDNWERSPYYVKGLIALAYTLDDPRLKHRAQKWIDWCLGSQRADGSYGPNQNDDWWPRMVSNYFLRDYFEATSDPRVLPFLTNYYRFMREELPRRPLRDWGKSRAGDEMDTVIWLYNRIREPFLLDVVDLLRKQAYDWPTIMRDNTFQGFGSDFQPKHNVNIPQAMKMPAVSWLRTGGDWERTAIDAGMAHLMREHGLSVGMSSGTEFLAGRSPGQGIEFCSIVEQMLSDETIVRIVGDGKYADHLEQVAYNALPAAWNRDLTALRYYTLPNHVIARRGRQGFGQDYDNGTVYGPRSGYPCCCFNVHQGWPKFVQNSWAATSDNGLAAIVYAPSSVTARVGDGTTVTIVEDTTYPFEDEVHFRVATPSPTDFPLVLRTPLWCEHATIHVNGQPVDAAKPGSFIRIRRRWSDGDEVSVRLPMTIRVQRGVNNSASIHRGPLVFSLELDCRKHVTGRPAPGFDEFEETPKQDWAYALDLDEQNPDRSIELKSTTKLRDGDNPFTAAACPLKLLVRGRRVPGWGLAWNGLAAVDPPPSPVASDQPHALLTLLPFGAVDLRVTDFPVLGEPARNTEKTLRFDFDVDSAGWSWIGGGWWVHDGMLRTTPTGCAPGAKALLENCTYSDVRIDAEIIPPPTGDAGVVFRVTRPSIGADAYEGYYAGISADSGQVIVGRADGTKWTPLKTVARQVAAGHATKLRVIARGEVIEVIFNGEPTPVVRITDDQWKAGQAGVRIYSTDPDHAIAAFDNIQFAPLGANRLP